MNDRRLALTAFAVAALVAALTVRNAFYVAGGTDSSGYVSAAERWLAGDLYAPAPLHFWAAWPNAVPSASPVAYRPGLIAGTNIQVYPLGLPVVFAAARSIGGTLAPFVVAPFCAGILTWCTFVIGRQLAGAAAGLVAAVLIAVTPVTLLHSVDAMSDVPAAALWLVAWVMSLRDTRGGAAAAGAAVAGAVMIRPNLAPLAIVPGLLVLLGPGGSLRRPGQWRWAGALIFIAMVLPGALAVAWSQAVLYGGPFVPGYVEWRSFFRAGHVVPNLVGYTRQLVALHTPLVLLGLLTPLLVGGRVAWSALAVLLLNLAVYLPYLPLDDWPFLRFLLPGLAALFVLFATLVVRGAGRASLRSPWMAAAGLAAVMLVVWQGAPQRRYALGDWWSQTRVRLMGRYLREVLPPNAAVLSFMHSGAIRYYTGRQIVRLDLLDPLSLDPVVDDLRRKGYRPVFVLDEGFETAPFRARFSTSRYGRLDWPPRATFTTVTRVSFFDAEDMDRFAAGQRWVTDVLP